MVQVSGVSKRFGSTQAVRDLSFEVPDGSIFGLLGPNGSGKTTTVKMILGLLDMDEGSIRVGGIDPVVDSRAVKSIVGYVSEEAILYSSMTARDVFELVASVREMDAAVATERMERYLSIFDALGVLDQSMTTLSRGQKQKVEITATLLHRPDLLILDEPLSGLDAKAVRVFKEILALHTERGGSVLFSTHILEIAEDLCDEICVIAGGTWIAQGTPAELRATSADADAGESGERSDRELPRLEDVFLKLTEQDESVQEIVDGLREIDG